jgi:hypothetical protein
MTESFNEMFNEPSQETASRARQLIVGVWVPVAGYPNETMEYRADGSVRMGMFGGMLSMDGVYRFIFDEVIEIRWGVSVSDEAEQVIGAIKEHLAETPDTPQVRVVQTSILQVAVTEVELKTLHLEKGRVGHFRRVR